MPETPQFQIVPGRPGRKRNGCFGAKDREKLPLSSHRRLGGAHGSPGFERRHRQQAALMTCITPSAYDSQHVHFVDGASGGYAAAASKLKALSHTGGGPGP